MNSHTTRKFRKALKALPVEIKEDAHVAYKTWRKNPYHPSLHFKELEALPGLWSVRIGLHWRAIATKEKNEITWIWIGSHSEYDKITGN